MTIDHLNASDLVYDLARHAEIVAGLRALADHLDERTADAGARRIGAAIANLGVLIPCHSAEEFHAAARALGGTRAKEADGAHYTVVRAFGPIDVRVYTSRSEVCERVVIGTETVEVPDPDAPKVTVEREVVEWRCAPLGEARLDP